MKHVQAILALAFILLATAACPHGRTLDVGLRPQETKLWCWAASGQMVMRFLGTDVSQCTQANNALNRNDCPCAQCTSPVADPPCVEGGFPDFGRYGFSFQRTSDTSLSWAQLKEEIDHGRPVAFSWHWNGEGGHMMVAVGYQELDGAPYVVVRDPGPPCSGDSQTITYAAYRSGTGYSHWDDFYDIHH